MLIEVNKSILDLNNNFIKDGENNVVTFSSVVCAMLNTTFPGEENLSGEEKLKRFNIMTKIYNKTEKVDLTVEECSLIKSLCAKGLGVLIYGRINQIIEEKE